ncbi:MAG TPA: DUF2079 domain-containing protein [Vicinamibacteria bacterium]
MSLARRLAVGAAWGAGAAGLAVGAARPAQPAALLALGAARGGLGAGVRPQAPALGHPWLALTAAALAALMGRWPEPAFFLLAPLVAAAAAWPIRVPGEEPPAERPLPRWTFAALFVAAAAVFFVQSANRFWSFGAGAKDLGLFFQTHWLIAHGLPPQNTVMGMHALADHMELMDWAVAPLLRLHDGSETLLLVQALALASAVFPLRGLGRRLLGGDRAGLALAAAWLLAPDVHLAVMFDYNPTQLGAAGLVWTAWALVAGPLPAALLAALLTCLVKENLCLYVALLAPVLGLRHAPRARAAAALALALGIFALEMTLLFPRFREGGFRHWEYEDLGETPADTAVAVATRPHQALGLMLDHPQKRRSLLLPLMATGYVGLAEPVSLALQTANWGERFLSTHRTRWWGYHYGVPAAAMALVGLALGWARLRAAGRDGRGLPRYVLLCALAADLLPPFRTPAGNRRSDLLFLRQPYAAAPEDAATQRAAVAFVGRNPQLKVAAQDRLLPHLAGRPHIYMLERAAEADVIALQMNGATWPEGRPAWKTRVRALWGTGGYAVVFCQGQSVVLARGAPPGLSCPALDAVLEDEPR